MHGMRYQCFDPWIHGQGILNATRLPTECRMRLQTSFYLVHPDYRENSPTAAYGMALAECRALVSLVGHSHELFLNCVGTSWDSQIHNQNI